MVCGACRGTNQEVRKAVQLYAPWLLPQFAALKDDPALHLQADLTAWRSNDCRISLIRLTVRLQAAAERGESNPLHQRLLSLLPDARLHLLRLIEDLQDIANQAGTLAAEMDFAFLLDLRRRLLSVGFDIETRTAPFRMLRSVGN